MKESRLVSSYFYEAWKKVGLSDEDAKQAAIESARSEVVIAAFIRSMARLERANTESCRKANNTILIAVGVVTTYLSLLIILVKFLT